MLRHKLQLFIFSIIRFTTTETRYKKWMNSEKVKERKQNHSKFKFINYE